MQLNMHDSTSRNFTLWGEEEKNVFSPPTSFFSYVNSSTENMFTHCFCSHISDRDVHVQMDNK